MLTGWRAADTRLHFRRGGSNQAPVRSRLILEYVAACN